MKRLNKMRKNNTRTWRRERIQDVQSSWVWHPIWAPVEWENTLDIFANIRWLMLLWLQLEELKRTLWSVWHHFTLGNSHFKERSWERKVLTELGTWLYQTKTMSFWRNGLSLWCRRCMRSKRRKVKFSLLKRSLPAWERKSITKIASTIGVGRITSLSFALPLLMEPLVTSSSSTLTRTLALLWTWYRISDCWMILHCGQRNREWSSWEVVSSNITSVMQISWGMELTFLFSSIQHVNMMALMLVQGLTRPSLGVRLHSKPHLSNCMLSVPLSYPFSLERPLSETSTWPTESHPKQIIVE